MARGHKNAHTDLTFEFVHELFDYKLSTGWLTYRKAPSNFKKSGEHAGTLTKRGYVRIIVNGQHYYAHRIIWLWMTGSWPEFEIDHIDGDKVNNKWTNLRKAESFQNMHYKGVQSNNTSGFKGVWKSSANRWCAEISIKGVKHIVGHYRTPEEAARAREAFSKKMLGEFHFGKH